MRILLVSHYYAEHGGGVEIVAGELADRLARRGLDILWAASGPAGPHPHPPPILGEGEGGGVARLPMPAWNVTETKLGFPYPFWSPLSLLRLFGAVRRCDVVHVHDSLYIGNFAACCWARCLGKPVVVTQHIGMVPYSKRLLRGLLAAANRTLARWVLRRCTRCIFISHKVQAYFSRFVHFRSPPQFIPNGVATGLFRPASPEERQRLRGQLGWPAGQSVMLFVGRFVEKKGLAMLRELAQQFPQCLWVLIGWGPDDPAKWGLANVRCLGRLDHRQITRYYQAADLFVLPSVGEGFPLVVQEAMACGTPVLISADTALGLVGIGSVAYVSDLQRDHWIALLREILAAPKALAARREGTADFARRHWDWKHCADQYLQLFSDLAGSGQGERGCRAPVAGKAPPLSPKIGAGKGAGEASSRPNGLQGKPSTAQPDPSVAVLD